jgi:hypothetical protein
MMGTVISPVHLGRIQKMVQDHQDDGVLMAGGERMYGTSDLDGFNFEKGAFFPPTVITDIDLNSPLWKEEIFGPVVVAKRFQVCSCICSKGCLLTRRRLKRKVSSSLTSASMAWVRPFGHVISREPTASPRTSKQALSG